MKKSTVIILTVIFTFCSCLCINTALKHKQTVNNQQNLSRINLVIDAGHGGIDAGTIGVDGTKEKDINLNIALKLYDFARVSGVNATLIRNGDYEYYRNGDDRKRSDLYNRMDYINSVHNSTLISIHQNHFENEKEHGMQIWYSPNDDKSPILADSILNITKKFLQNDNKRLNKKSGSAYYLLHKAKVPSVMVECGFMSNIKENSDLKNNDYQNKLAYLIMLGLNIYITEEL